MAKTYSYLPSQNDNAGQKWGPNSQMLSKEAELGEVDLGTGWTRSRITQFERARVCVLRGCGGGFYKADDVFYALYRIEWIVPDVDH